MRNLSLAAAAALLIAPQALAGGYIAPAVEIEPPPAPVGAWQGAYAGASLGYAFGGDDRVGLHHIESGERGDVGKFELSGFNAGLRVGYRWQRDNWVFGPELGYEGGSVEDTFQVIREEGSLSGKSKVKNVLALRLKAGYTVRPDTVVYGTLGVARADVEYRGKLTIPEDSTSMSVSRDFDKTGYVVGLGVEKHLSERWSVTGEYEYANFGETKRDFEGIVTKATPDYHNIKLGANYRF